MYILICISTSVNKSKDLQYIIFLEKKTQHKIKKIKIKRKKIENKNEKFFNCF